MSPQWKAWLTAAANAVLSGLFSGGTAGFIGVGWEKSLAIAGASALGSFGKWFAQHPLPGAGQ